MSNRKDVHAWSPAVGGIAEVQLHFRSGAKVTYKVTRSGGTVTGTVG